MIVHFSLCIAMVVLCSLSRGHANHRHGPDTSPDVDLVPAVRIRPSETPPGGNVRHSRGHTMHHHSTIPDDDYIYDYIYDYETETSQYYPETETDALIEGVDHETFTKQYTGQTTEPNDHKDPFDAKNEKYQNGGKKPRLSNILWLLPTLVSVAVLI